MKYAKRSATFKRLFKLRKARKFTLNAHNVAIEIEIIDEEIRRFGFYDDAVAERINLARMLAGLYYVPVVRFFIAEKLSDRKSVV